MDKYIAVQLTAYIIVADETLHHSLEAAHIYIEDGKLIQISMTQRLRRLVEHAARNIHRALRGNSTCRYKTIYPYTKTRQ